MGVRVCAAACLLDRVICGVLAKKLCVTDVPDDGLATVKLDGNGGEHIE